MSKFERVLSNEDLLDVYRSLDNPKRDRDSVIEAMGAAVDAAMRKLAEQEPVAWRFWLSGLQRWSYSSTHHGCGEPVYAHPVPSSQVNLDSSNHIADMRKMVADMYWISDEFSTETILDAFDPIVGMIDVSVGDTFEVKRAKALPSITVEVTEMTEYGDVKAYKVVGGDHIPDIGQMITPLAQRKIQSLLDKGEYRVIENATVLVNENGHAAIVNKGGAFYWVDNEALSREYDGQAAPVDIASDMCAALSSPLLRTRIKREVGKT